MRLVTYRSDRGARAGLLRDDSVVDLWDGLGGDGSSVRDLLASDRLGEAAGISSGEPLPLEQVALAPPVTNPEKIVCIGLNYRAHAAEAGIDPPESPTFFAKFRNALAPPGATVPLPAASAKVDFEAEVAFVVGRRAKDVVESQALDFVAGYMLLNDLSARDLQFATPQWMPGKVFDGSAPCGPALVTPDEAGPHEEISFSLTLNGEEMQAASTDDLVFSVPALVAHLSTLMTLEPGDVVSTGTPAGVGSTREPRVWLKPGDEIVISSPTLGRLETRIG
jgi:2-keto-4-pentenoate hydratase/2-oxohepta-3-ene-1,7-dioic acid hydratase in catechol pathway